MARTKELYSCRQCGNQTLVWQGQCPACREWNSLEAIPQSATGQSHKRRASRAANNLQAPTLEDLADDALDPRPTGIEELDRLLGHGLMPGGSILLGGEPGIGKSTLLLQLLGKLAASGKRAAYVSGEESLSQIKRRAQRMGLLGGGLIAISTNRAEDALGLLEATPPLDLIIVDSVQTLAIGEESGLPGSVGQVRAVAATLTEAARRTGATLVLVGHVTKEGHIAGPKVLEHMVDTVLALEGDRRHQFRILRVLKNRFGPSDELVVMEMRQDGLAVVADPATYFLAERDESLSGTALVMAVEGQRPFVVEVQALAGKSCLAIPRRTALGFDAGRLHLILAVMEKRLRIDLGQLDVYCKICGGLKIAEPGLDMGIAAAVLSSMYDRPLPPQAVFWGELDLNGMVRPVGAHELRLKQAKRLGYGPLYFSRQGREGSSTLAGLQQALFGQA